MTRDVPPVMIFAAGFGTRMMPLTKDRPKPMVSLLGKPLIDHALHHAYDICAPRIVTNLHYKGDVLRTHLSGTDVLCVEETPDILDTGGGLKNALPYLKANPVMTLNPDAIWKGANPLSVLLAHWSDDADALLLCVDPAKAHGTEHSGDFTLAPDGSILRGPGVIYGGAQMLNTDVLDHFKERSFSLNAVWDILLARGRCKAVMYPGAWCDVGTPAGVQIAEKMLENANV